MNTAVVSAASAERTRKNLSMILQRLASIGQGEVAQALGVSESTVSRAKEKEIPQFAAMLARLGLKVTPEEFQCYEPRTIEAILVLARGQLNKVKDVQELEWEPE